MDLCKSLTSHLHHKSSPLRAQAKKVWFFQCHRSPFLNFSSAIKEKETISNTPFAQVTPNDYCLGANGSLSSK